MTAALEISNLSKIYKGKTHALDKVSLEVKQGDFYSLLGANGAGKTTLLGILCGLVTKTSGNVKIFGVDIDNDFSQAKSQIAIVPQELNFNIFEKVISIVVNQAGYYGIPRKVALQRAEYYLQKLDLWHKRFTPAMHLSGGMKRRLMIVRALVTKPKLLILDEPTAGVDIELRRQMWAFLTELNNNGMTIILTTHYLEEAEKLCNNLAIIDKGKVIAAASMQDILAKLPQQQFILETESRLDNLPDLTAYNPVILGEHKLQLEVRAGQNLNQAFTIFNQHNINITSVTPQTGRLEELFVSLTSN